MAWVRIDDHFPEHRKLAELGDYAPLCGWLYVCGLGWCNRQLTDGRIPKAMVPRLATFRRISIDTAAAGDMATLADDIDADQLAERLVAVGLWEDHGDAFVVHDYLEYQPSRKAVGKLTQTRAQVGQRGARARWQTESNPDGKHDGKPMANGMAKPMAKVLAVALPVDVVGASEGAGGGQEAGSGSFGVGLDGKNGKTDGKRIANRMANGMAKTCPNPNPVSTPPNPLRGEEPSHDTNAAAWLLESYPRWYAEERSGAQYRCRPTLDWQAALGLTETWRDRAHLERMCRTFLRAGNLPAAHANRSLEVFARSYASGCDAAVRQGAGA